MSATQSTDGTNAARSTHGALSFLLKSAKTNGISTVLLGPALIASVFVLISPPMEDQLRLAHRPRMSWESFRKELEQAEKKRGNSEGCKFDDDAESISSPMNFKTAWIAVKGSGPALDLDSTDISSYPAIGSLDCSRIRDSNLYYVQLANNSIRAAYFIRDDMRGANFEYADLRGTTFYLVDLKDSWLNGAKLPNSKHFDRILNLQYIHADATDLFRPRKQFSDEGREREKRAISAAIQRNEDLFPQQSLGAIPRDHKDPGINGDLH